MSQPLHVVQQTPAAQAEPSRPGVSVVIPVMNEAENVVPLLEEITDGLAGEPAYEVIFVDDCSTDATVETLLNVRDRFPALRIIQHDVNCGQSAAIRSGVLAAKAPVVVTMDGDGQNDPADVPKLLDAIRAPDRPDALMMVSGRRRRRKDTLTKRFASKLANSIRKRLLKDGTKDTGCGLKAFYRDAFLRLPYFDHMHRYFSALMQREGYLIAFVDVNHRPRMHGVSKYGVLDRLLVSIRDLMGVIWLQARCRRPGERREL